MGNVRMRAEQINYGASNVKVALDDLDPKELIALSGRMDTIEAWKATVKAEEKTGAEVTFTNALALAAVSVSAEITPIQDLHGYDNPWVGGTGKNKLQNTATTATINGVTFTVNDDGTVKANGTATANAVFLLQSFSFAAQDYILNGTPSNGSASTYEIQVYLNGVGYRDFGSGVSIPASITASADVNIVVRQGVTVNNLVFKPMIRLSTESDATFAPWENICPISGRTAVGVDDVGKNKVETPSATAFTARGITLTTASNGETALNGTSTAGSIDGDTFELPAGTYTISVGTTLPSGVWVSLDGVTGAMISPTGKSITFTTTEAKNTFTHIYVNAGVAFNNFKFNWMLEEGNTATDYEPYTHSSVTIQLGTTVYGGTLNVTTGALTVTWVKKVVADTDFENFYLDTTNGSYATILFESGTIYDNVNTVNAKSSIATGVSFDDRNADPHAYRVFNNVDRILVRTSIDDNATTMEEIKAKYTGTDLLYRLKTPATIQLTPTQLTMLKGYNRLSSDGGGDITVEAYTGAAWGGDEA